jgi:peptide deformylase
MTIRKILTYPDKFLRQPTKPVLDIDSVIQELIDDMADTMYEAPGVGLAAIQVGCDQSILIYDRLPGEVNRSFEVLINPKIVDREGQIISQDEGCLSVPDFRADLKRAGSILVEGLDREGKPIQIEAEGNLAIVLQHEIDHLNGKLFIDHLSALKRELYKRRVKKMLRKK